MPTKEEFEKIINKLIMLGEDKEELLLWLKAFDTLAPEDQQELYTTCNDELEQLIAQS